ncbi:MAG: HNH endonuclease [Parvimonas sp.]|nr:HNH endonuclease [Parvimonas sp.]
MNNNFKEYIFKNFSYNPLTGKITRNDRKNSNGSFDKDGYLIIKIKGKQFKAHRLAFLLYYGYFPKKEIDHINRIRTDNRILNLREVTRLENIKNITKKINENTGEVGIYLDKTKGLKKNICFKYKNKTYRFYSIEEAKNKKEMLLNGKY